MDFDTAMYRVSDLLFNRVFRYLQIRNARMLLDVSKCTNII